MFCAASGWQKLRHPSRRRAGQQNILPADTGNGTGKHNYNMMKEESPDNYINPIEFWQKTADEIDGVFKLSKQTQNAGVMLCDYFHLRIFKEYRGINIELHSTFEQSLAESEKFELSFLRIETELENQDEFFLYTWRKGYFERTFSKVRNDDPFEFYKTIGYKTNRRKEVEALFSSMEIQGLFLELENSVFNIQFDRDRLKIKYQTNDIIKDKNKLISEYLKYVKFIDGLLSVKLIKPHHQAFDHDL